MNVSIGTDYIQDVEKLLKWTYEVFMSWLLVINKILVLYEVCSFEKLAHLVAEDKM